MAEAIEEVLDETGRIVSRKMGDGRRSIDRISCMGEDC